MCSKKVSINLSVRAAPAQIALAWEITKKPYLVPIPGTTYAERVKENFDAVHVEL